MKRNEKIVPLSPGEKTDVQPRPPHGPIEDDRKDPVNPRPEPPPGTTQRHHERPDLDWAEHED